ncbi:MAG: hypothetical protein IPH33_12730, partial [Bacteroidetes bacterium]|nr:hypothetical protein [Bacteroidota bacterium]
MGRGTGILGDSTAIGKNHPIQIGIDTNWTDIYAGGLHSLAIKSDMSLWAWGDNYFGQIGDSTFIDRLYPISINNGNNWKVISIGAMHSQAINTAGELFAWGVNQYGRLGDSTNINKVQMVKINTLQCLPLSLSNNILEQTNYFLYPNPVQNELFITAIVKKVRFKIVDVFNQMIIQGDVRPKQSINV